jgi:hypothetical protein
MATTKVTRSKTQGKQAAKAPAEVLREQQARIEEALKAPLPGLPEQGASEASKAAADFAAARRALADMPVPMTLGEICEVIGQDVVPEEFGSSALRAIADQIKTTAVLTETDWSADAWRLFGNISARAELAGRVAGWLAKETTEPAEVQP